MTTPENPLIDAARGRDPQPPAETQAEMLRRLAAAADKHGQHIYTHWRDSNAAKANEEWHNAASPALVISLLDRIAQLEDQQAVPHGWKLVPVKPTLGMLNVGFGICAENGQPLQNLIDSAQEKYAGLLNAAPEHIAKLSVEQEHHILTDEQIDAIFAQQPDGVQGFLKSWGYRNFAKDLLRYAGAKPAIDPQALMELVKKFAAAVVHNLFKQLTGNIEVAHEVIAVREEILAMVPPYPPAPTRQPLTNELIRSLILDDLFPHGITKEILTLITSVIRATESAHGIKTAP